MDPSTLALTAPVIATWGAYGVILIVLVIAIAYLGRRLIESYRDRLAENRDLLTSSIKTNAEVAQALRDMKTTVDAVIALARGK